MLTWSIGGMGGYLSGRQSEDRPTISRIHRGESEHVAEERAYAFRVRGVDDCVNPSDHVAEPSRCCFRARSARFASARRASFQTPGLDEKHAIR